MSLEEKMLMRFQKERVKKAKNLSMYNLDNGEEHILTHKGSILGAGNMADDGWVSSDEEDAGDQRLGREVVNALHFGGGLVAKKASIESSNIPIKDQDHPKSRAEILQEVIMKSKLHKMIKKETKDAIETQRDNLDKEFDNLMSSSTVKLKPMNKYERNEADSGGAAVDTFSDYDALFGAMQTEARAAPSDRTKTAEELAAEARERLEKLEAERARRMNPDASESQGALKISASKKRRITDDEVEFGDNYGWKNGASSDEEDEDDGDEDIGSEEEDEGRQEEEDSYNEDGYEEEGYSDEDAIGDDDELDDEVEDNSGEDISIDEDENEAAEIEPPKAISTELHANKKENGKTKRSEIEYPENDGINPMMPHKIECPTDISALDALVQKYVINPNTDLAALVGRIMIWNSVHLPGGQGVRNRESMHNFLDALIKLFVRIGSEIGSPNTAYSMDQVCSSCCFHPYYEL
jgi:nucleolar protein 14